MANPAAPLEPPQRRSRPYLVIAHHLALQGACKLQGVNQEASNLLAAVAQHTNPKAPMDRRQASDTFELFWLTYPFSLPQETYVSIRRSLRGLWEQAPPLQAAA